ncbi:unnamed protein product [Clonostachys rosea]|uniref:Uncharacterized protein n=1 Tax=Bionectria ochroleuca TaxID=29856 RepID=A0ABY6U7Q4_BIOOC|nr:unnamed protein product [Clonostachys rosea]
MGQHVDWLGHWATSQLPIRLTSNNILFDVTRFRPIFVQYAGSRSWMSNLGFTTLVEAKVNTSSGQKGFLPRNYKPSA